VKLADSHLHFFAPGYRSRYDTLFPNGRELEVYQSIRRAHQIDTALVVGYEGMPLYHGHNDYLARLAARHRWIHPVAYCPVARPPTPQKLAARLRQRFAGISIYINSTAEGRQLTRWPEKLVALLNERRALISINVQLASLASVEPFFRRVPDTHVLISHLALPWKRGSLRPLTALAKLPHVGMKASGFYACNAPYPHQPTHAGFATILDAFGPRRLYWGSDFSPVLEFTSFAQTIDVLDSLRLGDADRRRILGDNLRGLLQT
jgi:predicted TIM-barrel fold metal-dependent hydrolase